MSEREKREFFVTCAPGLEPLLHDEIRALKLAHVERQVGGVFFTGSLADAWRANLWLRTAVRVLMRVARFPATDADELYHGVQTVDWSEFVLPEGTLVVDAHARDSNLRHTRFLEQRVKDAVVDQLRARSGVRPSVDKDDPDLAIHVHLFRDRCTLLLDTSGGSLHKRGWRRHQGRAPLSETLAAAMVLWSGWDGRAPLIDPFCGSGTILIEAALIAAHIAPGLWRERFGFERWPGHDADRYAELVRATRGAAGWPRNLQLLGFDADPAAIAGARQNVAAAGLSGKVALEVQEIADFSPRRGWNAWIVSNPPYGERVLEPARAAALLRSFAAILRERCAGFHVTLLSGHADLPRALGFAQPKRTPLKNGALDCELLDFQI
jgi:putative N6-adenine-specific DNA methylase